jgi:fimbrial isopeptide formation D2 family protein/LPXTG-motif cell wall-anchored protein
MNNLKRLLALVLAVMMVASLCSFAFAADDTSVTITGLDENDAVKLYQVLKWENGTGWVLTDAFASLSTTGIDAIIAGTTATLSKADVEAITNFVKAASPAITPTKNGSVASGETSYTETVDLGLYLALVNAAKVDTLYNPMIVSADLNNTNDSDTVASSDVLGASTVAKKDTVTLEKTHSDITFNAGDYVQFTVTTKIPAFADSYAPWFHVTDTLSAGLEYEVNDSDHKFVVSSGDVTFTGTPSDGDKTFTLEFDSAKIEALTAPQDVTITYWAKITSSAPYNVNAENNTVEVTFSNNPGNDSDHGHLKDKTVEYLFDIDGAINGNTSYITSEIVKVGVDASGHTVFEEKTMSNGSKHNSLPGATFGIYTTQADADAGNTNYYTNEVFTTGTVQSDANGLLNIKGLKAGKYYIKELTAPAGYIKDQATHYFEITTTTGTQTETETLSDSCVVTYEYTVLTGYSVSFDGTKTSSYTWTNNGPQITSVMPGDDSSEIQNTKGLELPSTGGIGTTIFYVAGIVLVLGAAAIVIARRKAEQE